MTDPIPPEPRSHLFAIRLGPDGQPVIPKVGPVKITGVRITSTLAPWGEELTPLRLDAGHYYQGSPIGFDAAGLADWGLADYMGGTPDQRRAWWEAQQKARRRLARRRLLHHPVQELRTRLVTWAFHRWGLEDED